MAEDALFQAAAIGLVCGEWSTLEYNLSIVIWRLLGLDPDTGKIVTGGLDLLPRVNMAINLARHVKQNRATIAALERARKTVQDGLDARRNQAVHGVHFAEDDGSTTVEVHRGKGGRNPVTITGDAYSNLADEIRAVRKQLQTDLHAAGFVALPAPRAIAK
jgi:hypothetical protein